MPLRDFLCWVYAMFVRHADKDQREQIDRVVFPPYRRSLDASDLAEMERQQALMMAMP